MNRPWVVSGVTVDEERVKQTRTYRFPTSECEDMGRTRKDKCFQNKDSDITSQIIKHA